MSDEADYVVCSPWGDQHVPSVAVQCCGCRAELAMSESVRGELPAAEAICAFCAVAAAPDEMPHLTPGGRKEIVARLGFDPGAEPGVSLRDWIKGRRP